jgi:hypothetical protein
MAWVFAIPVFWRYRGATASSEEPTPQSNT